MAECYEKVQCVLRRFKQREIKLCKEKCKFFEKLVTYLGNVLDERGVRPSDKKLRAIKEVPTPKYRQELRSYLGLLNFYGKFMPNMSTQLKTLYDLLIEKAKWEWTEQTKRCFRMKKEWLKENSILSFYDLTKDLGVTCNASSYGVRAILFYKIAFSSKTYSVRWNKATRTQRKRPLQWFLGCVNSTNTCSVGSFPYIQTTNRCSVWQEDAS